MPPIHNAIKYGTDLLRSYSRAVGLGEEEEGTVRLGETLTPTLEIFTRPEWALLRGERLATGGAALAAPGAGLINQIQLFNPATSRRIAVVRWEAGSSATAVYEIRTTQVLLTLDSGIWKVVRDSRAVNPVAVIFFDNTAAAAVGTRRFQSPNVLANTPYRYDPWWVLSPGFGLTISTGAQNQALTVNFEWYERPVMPGELFTS